MSTRENIRLIARAPFRRKENLLTFCHFEPTSEVKDVSTDIFSTTLLHALFLIV